MKVAIIHYWLVGMRGGEKVLEALCRLYPEADIYTHIYDKEETSDLINSHNIYTTFISKLPRARKWYQNYLPLMPLALAQLDLSKYDLVISSESGPAKGVLTSPDTAHVCYCHSPMRYAWDMYAQYVKRLGFIKRFLAAPVMNFMRIYDSATANGPDVVIANSSFISKRIKKCWGRDSLVVHPPVAVNDFTALPRHERKDFYLLFGEMVAYKRADLAIKAFTSDGKRKLMVIGSGEEFASLKKIAGANITFLGRQPFEIVKHHLSSCRALIFPGLEDFGIIPVEALASGTPVIAYGRGGVLDTVKDGVTGIFFNEQTEEALLSAVSRFEENENKFDIDTLKAEAAKFSEDSFALQMSKVIEASLIQKKTI